MHSKRPTTFEFESSFEDLDATTCMTTLNYAAEAGDLDFVRTLLPICKDKAVTIYWNSLINHAVRSGSEELVEYLLNYIPQAELAALERDGLNLWYTAARNGLGGIIRWLIASGRGYPSKQHITIGRDGRELQSKYKQRDEKSPLHAAIFQGSEPIVSMLLEFGAGIDDFRKEVNAENVTCSPLHASVLARNRSLVELLLERGADIQSTMRVGDTALHIAARMGLEDIAELLIDRGGDLHAQGFRGERPLDTASRKGHKGMVGLLVRRGAQLSHVGAEFSPLHAAVRESSASKDVVKFLIEEGLEVDIRTTDGETPLYLAVDHAPEDVIELLIALGADPNITSSGKTPLGSLLESAKKPPDARTFRIIQLLGERTDAKTKNSHLRTVVQERWWYVNKPATLAGLVDALISIGANVNTQYDGGKNLLFFIRHMFLDAIVKLLLERGVNASAVDDDGNTVFHHFAKEYKNAYPGANKLIFEGAVKLIVAAGADLNAMNHNSERAVDVLRAQGIEIPPEGSI